MPKSYSMESQLYSHSKISLYIVLLPWRYECLVKRLSYTMESQFYRNNILIHSKLAMNII